MAFSNISMLENHLTRFIWSWLKYAWFLLSQPLKTNTLSHPRKVLSRRKQKKKKKKKKNKKKLTKKLNLQKLCSNNMKDWAERSCCFWVKPPPGPSSSHRAWLLRHFLARKVLNKPLTLVDGRGEEAGLEDWLEAEWVSVPRVRKDIFGFYFYGVIVKNKRRASTTRFFEWCEQTDFRKISNCLRGVWVREGETPSPRWNVCR